MFYYIKLSDNSSVKLDVERSLEIYYITRSRFFILFHNMCDYLKTIGLINEDMNSISMSVE